MEREEQRRKEQEQIRQELYLEEQEAMERKKEMVSAGRCMKGPFSTLWIYESTLFVTGVYSCVLAQSTYFQLLFPKYFRSDRQFVY